PVTPGPQHRSSSRYPPRPGADRPPSRPPLSVPSQPPPSGAEVPLVLRRRDRRDHGSTTAVEPLAPPDHADHRRQLSGAHRCRCPPPTRNSPPTRTHPLAPRRRRPAPSAEGAPRPVGNVPPEPGPGPSPPRPPVLAEGIPGTI